MKRKLKRRSVNKPVPKFHWSRTYRTRWEKVVCSMDSILSYDLAERTTYFLFPRFVHFGSYKSRVQGYIGESTLYTINEYERRTGATARDDMFKETKDIQRLVYHEKKTN